MFKTRGVIKFNNIIKRKNIRNVSEYLTFSQMRKKCAYI